MNGKFPGKKGEEINRTEKKESVVLYMFINNFAAAGVYPTKKICERRSQFCLRWV